MGFAMTPTQNPWKAVWTAYYDQSSKISFWRQLWRRAPGWTKWILALNVIVLIIALKVFINDDKSWPPLAFLMLTEAGLFALLGHMKEVGFDAAFGTADETLAPADTDDYRQGRFLIFRNALETAKITKSHVADLFEIVDAKMELESHRNAVLNRFMLFVSGLLTALLIAWIRGLSASESLQAVAVLCVVCAIIGPVLWLRPSRLEKLKELRYFMLLFARSLDR